MITIVIGKMPYLVARSDGRSGSQRINNILMSKASTIDTHSLVAATGETENPADTIAIEAISAPLTPSLDQCSLEAIGATMEELRDHQRDAIGGGSTEDNGRYVGYGQRTLTQDTAGARYTLAKTLFSSDNGCYTTNDLAKSLCESQDQLTTGSVATLASSLASTYEYAAEINTKLSDGDIFSQDAVSLLTEYYQSRTVETTADSVAIPYRWLVPANITFNRSLQNASSYYTDIGVIWLPALLIVFI
ncbi:MAG: hypothetical protein H6766_05250 [Candidatus Peribacteria bacterium]|nr:MAG: hypothetical protein H6766_05250 [Candidatus Peribacteria bacterium]